MAVASGVCVANIYYCQPLLSEIGRSLGVSDRAIGYLPMWTQAGTALGMFTFVPLGDMFPRRKLIVLMSVFSGLTVAMMAVAPNLALLNAAASSEHQRRIWAKHENGRWFHSPPRCFAQHDKRGQVPHES